MIEKEIINLERLVRTETKVKNISDDLKDIKKSIRWLTGLVFSLNTTIIGILTKLFGVFG